MRPQSQFIQDFIIPWAISLHLVPWEEATELRNSVSVPWSYFQSHQLRSSTESTHRGAQGTWVWIPVLCLMVATWICTICFTTTGLSFLVSYTEVTVTSIPKSSRRLNKLICVLHCLIIWSAEVFSGWLMWYFVCGYLHSFQCYIFFMLAEILSSVCHSWCISPAACSNKLHRFINRSFLIA